MYEALRLLLETKVQKLKIANDHYAVYGILCHYL